MKCPCCEHVLTIEECEFADKESYEKDYNVNCDDCGYHTAYKCPKCSELIDIIYYGE